MNRKTGIILLISFAVLMILPWMGAEPISSSDFLIPDTFSYRIFWDLRIPRLLVTLSLGGILATIGTTYQSLFRNPLCEPYILGISSAVLLGLVSSEVFFNHTLGTPLSLGLGIGFALVLVFFLMLFSSSVLASSDRIVLFGMGANFVLSSLLFLLLSFRAQSVGGETLKWFFGFLPWASLNKAIWSGVGSLLVLGVLLLSSRTVEALRLGDSVARTLGVSPVISRNIFLFFTSLVLAFTVMNSGTIGFVGLVVPQVCRILFSPQSIRVLFVQSFWIGSLFLAISDAISRAMFPPFEFPVGVITTLIGGPLFLVTLWKRT